MIAFGFLFCLAFYMPENGGILKGFHTPKRFRDPPTRTMQLFGGKRGVFSIGLEYNLILLLAPCVCTWLTQSLVQPSTQADIFWRTCPHIQTSHTTPKKAHEYFRIRGETIVTAQRNRNSSWE